MSPAENGWRALVSVLEEFDEREELARVRSNLAACRMRSGSFDDALAEARAAITVYRELEMDAEAVRSEWMIGEILIALGRHDEGLAAYFEAATAFSSLGMIGDEAFAKLDITAEFLRRG